MSSMFSRVREGLARTAQQIREKLRSAEPAAVASAPGLTKSRASVNTIDALEDALLTADVGLGATERILDAVRNESQGTLGERVERTISRILLDVPAPREITTTPHVVLIVGVNGTGKTTTVGKLARLYQAS